MSAVISVFVVWFGLVAVLGVSAVIIAPRVHLPRVLRVGDERASLANARPTGTGGRAVVALVVSLAAWAAVIIIGWALGLLAHKLQNGVDWPVFRWFERHHLGGSWSHVWRRLTNIGAPWLTRDVAIVAAVASFVLYFGRKLSWLPGATILLGYLATFYAQIIVKDVVHRGHPPTTLGTWPSGGVARVLVVFGLIIFFVILRFWRRVPRAWAAGGFLLLVLASIQAYARLYNLEHWLTDVIGGFVFGGLLLTTMVGGYLIFAGEALPRVERSAPRQDPVEVPSAH